VPEDAIVDGEQLRLMGIAERDMPAALAAIDAHMSRFRLSSELSRFPLALQIFRATR